MAPAPSSSPAQRARLPELDALRGIAAVAVLIYHYSTRYHEMFPTAGHLPFAFPPGHDAVLLFFAISGFVIAFSLEKIDSASEFVVKRFARLYPAYWGAMLLTLVAEYAGGVSALQVSPLAALANMSMLQSFGYLPSVDGVYWTLALELAFYGCMILLWKLGATRRLEVTVLGWLALAGFASLWSDMPSRLTMLWVLDYIPFFAIGMLSYRVWAGERTWAMQGPYMLAVLATVAILDRPDALVFAIMLFALFGAMLAGWLRFLASPPLLWLGTISYALYLTHHNIGFIIMLNADAAGLSPWLGSLLAAAVALGLAVALNRWVEQPATRMIGLWWKRRRPAPINATVTA